MTSPVDIVNQALDNIGARATVSSLTPPDNSLVAQVAARHYQPKMDALFRAAHWNCARIQTPTGLTVLKAAAGTPENPNGTTLPIPPLPWQYEYAYPSDCLKARFLVDGSQLAQSVAGTPPIFPSNINTGPSWISPVGYRFAVAIDTDVNNQQIKVILTDLEFAMLVYTGRIANPDLWDPHLQLAATATLGAWFVNPINRNAELLKDQVAIASSLVTQARISDGNEGLTSQDHLPDWMQIRGTIGFSMAPHGAQCFYGWDPMGFPGGSFV